MAGCLLGSVNYTSVRSFATFAAFPAQGVLNVLYLDSSTGDLYYWNGSAYASAGGGSVASYATFAGFPVTGAVGIVYIDEALADMYLWTGTVYELQSGGGSVISFWFKRPSENTHIVEEYDQFPGQVVNFVGMMYGVSSGASSAVQPRDASESQAGINSTEKAIGVTSLNPGTSSTGRSALGFGGAQGAASYRFGNHQLIYGVRQHLWAVGSAGENYTNWVGFMDIITAAPTRGCFFRYNYAVNSGRWEYCTVDGGATTAVDTGVGFTVQVYQIMEIVVNRAGTSVQFFIDGTLVGTVSSGIPTGAFGLLAMTSILRSAGTGAGGAGVASIDANYMATERLSVR